MYCYKGLSSFLYHQKYFLMHLLFVYEYPFSLKDRRALFLYYSTKGFYECVSKSFRTESCEINNNKHLLRSNTKGYGGKTHSLTDSQYSDTTAINGRELYHLQFSLQAAGNFWIQPRITVNWTYVRFKLINLLSMYVVKVK